MDKDKKKKTETDQSWDKFKDFASNLMQVKPEEVREKDESQKRAKA